MENRKFIKFIKKLIDKINNLSGKKVLLYTVVITAFIVTLSAFSYIPHASIDSGITNIEAFDKLSGHGEYLSSVYRNNYYLDIVELGITQVFEKAMNGIANVLFSLYTMIAYIAITTFYYCFDLNIADLFKDTINGMQSSLKTNIFDNMFLLVFVFVAVYLIKQLFKRNTTEIVSQITKVIFITVLASMLTTQTSAVLSASTSIAKTVGAQAMVAINKDENNTDEDVEKTNETNFAATIAGELWYSMVHQSWEMMEGGNFSEDEKKELLKLSPDDDKRQDKINDMHKYNGVNNEYFRENIGVTRVPQALLILVVVILKAGVLLLLALIQLAFQIVAILCVLLSIIALLLALVPQLGGIVIIENLAKRILETQLGIVITTFMIALVTKMDTLIMDSLQDSLNCGWLIALILQSAVYVCIYIYRKQILKLISVTHRNLQRGDLVSRNAVAKVPAKVTETYCGGSLRSAQNKGGMYKKNNQGGEKTGISRGGEKDKYNKNKTNRLKKIFEKLNLNDADDATNSKGSTDNSGEKRPNLSENVNNNEADKTKNKLKNKKLNLAGSVNRGKIDASNIKRLESNPRSIKIRKVKNSNQGKIDETNTEVLENNNKGINIGKISSFNRGKIDGTKIQRLKNNTKHITIRKVGIPGDK